MIVRIRITEIRGFSELQGPAIELDGGADLGGSIVKWYGWAAGRGKGEVSPVILTPASSTGRALTRSHQGRGDCLENRKSLTLSDRFLTRASVSSSVPEMSRAATVMAE